MNDASLRAIKKLCTDAEFAVLKTTSGAPLKAQSPAELRRTLSKLRGFRDKWRSQTISQRRRVRATRGGNAMLTAGRSESKERAFAEAIERVEAMLGRADKKAVRRGQSKAKPVARGAFSGPKRAALVARKRGRGAIGESRSGVAAADRKRHVREAGIDTRVLGHVSNQGRRNQARRDQRRAVALSAPRFAQRVSASRAR